MKITNIKLGNEQIRLLVVGKKDPKQQCENCGFPCYSHELLAKEDPDWCMSCNDDYYRKNWSDVQIGNWAIEQMSRGLAVGVIADTEEE